MPLYEYQCEQCNEVFEVMQKFSDVPLSRHEKCGGPVHRLVSAPTFHFKGSGWYVTDYARAGKNADNGGEKKADAPGGEKPASDAGSGAEAGKSSSSEKTSSSEKSSSSETKAESSSEKK